MCGAASHRGFLKQTVFIKALKVGLVQSQHVSIWNWYKRDLVLLSTVATVFGMAQHYQI